MWQKYMSDLLLANVRIVDAEKDAVSGLVDVRIEGQAIAEIGRNLGLHR